MTTVRGRVVKGDGLGRKLGFPTANLKLLAGRAPNGVWRVDVEGATIGRRTGVCNVGVRPTVGGKRRVVEVHVPRFAGDLYGRTLKVTFTAKLRGEKRFASLSELKTQIRRDVRTALSLQPSRRRRTQIE